ncbi:tripartite motif-containing protein [Pimephales promelas]|nr:tripartite motif-containing protein [Pimephales promelas]
MAESSISVARDQFSCSICLDLLKDPVTIPCGHSYCMSCITDCWNKDDQKRVYSCPQCRQTFTPRPALNKNVMFAGMVDNLKKTKVQTARPALSYAGPGDVECDVCTGRKCKAKALGDIQRKFQQRIQEREKELRELKEAVKTHQRSAQAALEVSERIFTELIRSIKKSQSEVTRMIRDQEKAQVSRAEGLLKRLEKEIDDLRRREAELKQLSHTDNHIHFLQSFPSLSVPPAFTESINISSFLSYDDVEKSVSMLREKLEDLCNEDIKQISGKVTYIEIVTTTEPRSRDDFLQYCHQLTLDSNTAHKYLRLSEGNRVATFIGADQLYPVHPHRFHVFSQVLCRESVCGRCYWEVEWSGGVGISVSYKSISRKGDGEDCVFGFNDQSWRLSCSDSRFAFRHNQKEMKLPVVHSSSRIGVYVDHSAGILAFYSVSDTMTLIHRIQTVFTQPLYPGFGVNLGSTVKLSS